MTRTLVSILTGLGGMFGWGISDFFANLSSDKVGHTRTFFWSRLCGFLIILLTTVIVLPDFNMPTSMIPLLLVGVVGYIIGLLNYYKSFEAGNLSVVAVVINLNAVFTMLVAYFVFGQRLTGFQLPATFLIITGIMLTSINFEELTLKRKVSLVSGVKEALIAAAGFGIIHWPITEYIVERTSWIWNALIVRILALIGVIVIASIKRESLRLNIKKRNIVAVIIATGTLESLAILSVNYGFAVGDSILIAPIANSVAIVTVTLAVIFLKEKLTKVQLLGILTTIAGIILSAF